MILVVLGHQDYGATMKERVTQAIALYNSNPRMYSHIIPSGGTTSRVYSEAYCMKKMLIKGGIPKSKIILENKATTTTENAKFVHKIVGNVPIIVVTSPNHIKRAKQAFSKQWKKCNPVILNMVK